MKSVIKRLDEFGCKERLPTNIAAPVKSSRACFSMPPNTLTVQCLLLILNEIIERVPTILFERERD